MSELGGVVEVRDAAGRDRDAIIDFNARLALETEGKVLDVDVLRRGVEAAMADPGRLRYWMAVVDGRPVGQAAATREWSDWRCGWVWWLQSVYVEPESRGRGVFRALHRHLRDLALADPSVIGLRLYVEAENEAAQRTYRRLGMLPGGYLVFEELWRDRFRPRPG